MFDKEDIERYCRQLILPSFGVTGINRTRFFLASISCGLVGQRALWGSAVLVVGCGGLGCPVALYLAAAGVGRLGLVDYDVVEISNLHRQVGHTEARRGETKVSSLATTLRALNTTITVEEHHTLLSSNNALDILGGYDVVVDATDNVVTRYLLSDACVLLDRVLVSGAALRLEGQLTTYHFQDGPCYRCLYPEPPPAELVTNCDQGGVLGPVPGMIGSLQALEVIKLIAMSAPNYSQKMLLFDGTSGSFRTVKLRGRRRNCEVCGDDPTITQLADYVAFCNSTPDDKGSSVSLLAPADRITVQELHQLLSANVTLPFTLLDVRSQVHSDIFALPRSLPIPLESLRSRIDEVPRDGPVLCICRRGNDSQRAVVLLRELGFEARDVIGGLHEYARRIDPTCPIY